MYDGASVDETLEEALAEERTLELESELEQDEHPRDYHAELEDEEEEAAPTSEKLSLIHIFHRSVMGFCLPYLVLLGYLDILS